MTLPTFGPTKKRNNYPLFLVVTFEYSSMGQQVASGEGRPALPFSRQISGNKKALSLSDDPVQGNASYA